MPLNKQRGNMYNWVTHTWNPLGGRCPHQCQYCYIEDMRKRPVIAAKYSGDPHLVEKEMKTILADKSFPDGCTIFICNMSDMWAEKVARADILAILQHCELYPDNQYVFQTKNPARMVKLKSFIPAGSILGSTIETDDTQRYTLSTAPPAGARALNMHQLREFETFITIEPIVRHSYQLVNHIKYAQPNWVNIGADSRGSGLAEPSWPQIQRLIEYLKKFTDVKLKSNLKRLELYSK